MILDTSGHIPQMKFSLQKRYLDHIPVISTDIRTSSYKHSIKKFYIQRKIKETISQKGTRILRTLNSVPREGHLQATC